MRWGSRGLLSRSARQRLNYPTSRRKSCVNWRGCAPGLQEDFASRLRPLHRAVDLGFPEFTRHVHTLESQLAAAILSRYPTAASFHGVSVKKLARIVYDGSHKIGEVLSRALIDEAANSVGSHHSEPYRLRIRYLCHDLDVLRRRLKDLARDIERKLDDQGGGQLLTTI